MHGQNQRNCLHFGVPCFWCTTGRSSLKASCASHGARAMTSADEAGVPFCKSLPFYLPINSNIFISFCPKRICLQAVSISCSQSFFIADQSIYRLSIFGEGADVEVVEL